jgi:hypothetical protein
VHRALEVEHRGERRRLAGRLDRDLGIAHVVVVRVRREHVAEVVPADLDRVEASERLARVIADSVQRVGGRVIRRVRDIRAEPANRAIAFGRRSSSGSRGDAIGAGPAHASSLASTLHSSRLPVGVGSIRCISSTSTATWSRWPR